MKYPNGYVDADVYIQVAAKRGWAASGNDKPVVGARAVAMTQGRPTRPHGGTVTVRVTLRIPKAAFDPLRPEAIVVIPETLTEANPVVVEAEDPTDNT